MLWSGCEISNVRKLMFSALWNTLTALDVPLVSSWIPTEIIPGSLKQTAEKKGIKILTLNPSSKGKQHSHLHFSKKYKLRAIMNYNRMNYCFLVLLILKTEHESHVWHSGIDTLYTVSVCCQHRAWKMNITSEQLRKVRHWVTTEPVEEILTIW